MACEHLNSNVQLYGLACSGFGGHSLQICTQTALMEQVKVFHLVSECSHGAAGGALVLASAMYAHG